MLFDLNMNVNLIPETMVYDDMYNVKYRQPDTLYEPIILEPFKQIRVSCIMFKVTRFVYFWPYLKSFSTLKRYVRKLEEQLTDIVKDPNNKFIEQKIVYNN